MSSTPSLYTWGFISSIVVFSTAGDVLLAKAMTRIGDLGELFGRVGLLAVVRAIFSSGTFLGGLLCMSCAFFSLLVALNWGDLSLVVPAAASLTFLGNAICAKFFLGEKLDSRRWISLVLVVAGVALLAH